MIADTKEVLCSESTVSRYARVICAMNLQCIAELLRKCHEFSLALEMAAHLSTAYFDVSIPIFTNALCMYFNSYPSPCMTGTLTRLYSTHSPR